VTDSTIPPAVLDEPIDLTTTDAGAEVLELKAALDRRKQAHLATCGLIAAARIDLDAVYRERAHLVAHLASLYPSVLVESAPDAPDWAIVYVDLPTGQASWHIATRDLPLFAGVQVVPADDPRAVWDQHSTAEKYRRVATSTRLVHEGRDALGDIEADAARIAYGT